jgi:DNA-directed RNA polymerase subunit RPC12/RpoP
MDGDSGNSINNYCIFSTFMPDDLDDFLEFDFTMGANVVKCPDCGADVPCSLLFDDEVKCPKCGKIFKKDEDDK